MTITYRELLAAAESSGLTVTEHKGGAKGFYWHHYRTISIREGLSDRQRLSTFAHELGHAFRGDEPTGTVFDIRAERAADKYAAMLLISPAEYAAAEAIHGAHIDAIAYELGVSRHLVQVWQKLQKA